ncbi:MAG: glucosaminidase domain-containing protein [Paludibacteraceae bacterium]|nr:glucosaminidase domain-containing protein [Paludibacteraceae bacterium]
MKKVVLLILFACVTNTLFSQTKKNATYVAYIEKYAEIAMVEQSRHKIPACITLAQALLESSAGQSELSVSSNNHFGIKCHSNWEGERVYHDDDKKGECFRKYEKVIDSYEDHSLFLKRDRYKLLFTYKITDYKAWAYGLKAAGYATDPQYPDKLIKIIEDYDLAAYTDPKRVKEATDNYNNHSPKASTSSKDKEQVSEKESAEVVSDMEFGALNMYIIHDVKKTNNVAYIITTSTDTWASIAKEFGLKERELRKFNEYPNDVEIKAGMKIYVQAKKNKVSTKPFVHTVDYNESMHDIAQKYGVKMLSIYKLNGKEKWSKVKVGEKLKLK